MVERFLARKTDRIVVLSPEQADEISRTYRVCPAEKIVIIPVGLDLEPFVRAKPEGLRKSLGISPNIFLVGFVGRLTKIKRTSVLLQALAGLKSQLDQPLALVIVGQGELQPELESEAASLGIAEQVHFVGWQERMPGIYASLDALVLPSANEGLPLVLIEALAAGRPVAATPVGGVPGLLGLNGRPERGDFIKGLRGLSFLPDDPAGLAKALGWVARQNEAALELTAAGQRYVIENHSKEVSLAAHAELYRSLAEARR